ncbi:chloride channel protein [Thermogymnomonas acidicola]|uniref:chloride channel protein n=1 Tax=Thermogymnomonas acidicola TaxID=399579 RepID=UPI001396AE28|nr:chloride channel protein [Thermogymnomonas acidicola]
MRSRCLQSQRPRQEDRRGSWDRRGHRQHIHGTPGWGGLLSTEILYRRDFEVEALIPSIIASVVGYSIFGYLFQYRPIFYTDPSFLFFERPESLLAYALVGILAGLLGKVYVNVFYGIQGLFRKWNITRFAKPAIGGLLVGLIAIKFPQVLGLGGYGWVQLLLNENLYLMPLYILIILIFVKIVATSLTIGSGGSGGVFAPGIVIGSFFGAAMGIILHPPCSPPT